MDVLAKMLGTIVADSLKADDEMREMMELNNNPKGDWEKQFDKKNTAKDKFFLPSGEAVMADMMVQETEIPYAVLDNIDSTIVELPYKGDRIVMQIVLPNEKSGLRGLEEKIDSVDIADIFKQHQRNTKVKVKMPK